MRIEIHLATWIYNDGRETYVSGIADHLTSHHEVFLSFVTPALGVLSGGMTKGGSEQSDFFPGSGGCYGVCYPNVVISFVIVDSHLLHRNS